MFVVSFAHCKGGVGKSTICCHIAIALKVMYPHLKIGLINLDVVNNTAHNFLFNRNNVTLDLIRNVQSVENIHNIVQDEILDILLIDTASGESAITYAAIKNTNILITPLQHSLADIDALVNVQNNTIINGPFTTIVNKHKTDKLKWLIIHNRLPLVNVDEKYTNLLRRIAIILNAELFTLHDRMEYRIALDTGITVHELNRLTKGDIATRNEIDTIVKRIMEQYELFSK